MLRPIHGRPFARCAETPPARYATSSPKWLAALQTGCVGVAALRTLIRIDCVISEKNRHVDSGNCGRSSYVRRARLVR